ncbi:hypothetical protein HBH70_091850 [Parastagonospora nodorum]|nr:hypothetical protein HBH70_091850 [Parastagonospora nodorum]
MKTGISELFSKIPTQLITTLGCLHDYLIFSDMEHTVAGVQIYDSLDNVLQDVKSRNPEFNIYHEQQDCIADQESCSEGANRSHEAWVLDKYKTTHIAGKTFYMRPNYKWYIFIEADTYVLWPNLVQWLGSLNSSEEHFLGSLMLIGDVGFAYGGSGYILSQPVLKEFSRIFPTLSGKYDYEAKSHCCGDYIFSVALNETLGLSVKDIWPKLNTEKPYTLPFGPTHWCGPAVTMHHMSPEEISSFWEFEGDFYRSQSTLRELPRKLSFRDIYNYFVAPKLLDAREDWDNLSDDIHYSKTTTAKHDSYLSDIEKTAHQSFENCKITCEANTKCFQFRFHDGTCSISTAFKLGRARKGYPESDRWMSGWMKPRIQEWIKDIGECL